MKSRLLLSCALLLPVWPGLAQPGPAQKAPSAFAKMDKNLDAISKGIAAIKPAVKAADVLENELTKKKAELRKEFAGKIPASFDDLLTLKSDHIARLRQAAAEQSKSVVAVIEETDGMIRNFEPPSEKGLSQRRDTLQSYREQMKTLFH